MFYQRAMRFLENTDLLKIEDILPFFPDFVVIDDFKEEIAHALEGYSAQIDTLKAEMDDATKTAEAIKQDIATLKNRFITISPTEQCSKCSTLLLTRQFYVFPCHHTFHADCLIALVRNMSWVLQWPALIFSIVGKGVLPSCNTSQDHCIADQTHEGVTKGAGRHEQASSCRHKPYKWTTTRNTKDIAVR
jgi:hypothetical protein